jgi:large subunit ribosomal protein L24
MQYTKPVKDPRKQRKMLYNAPAHIRHKFMGAHLSNELAASRGIKTLPVRKGDTVRIVRGDNIGFEGKVSRVDLKRYRIFIEGLTREKVDGTNIFVSVHPSKVMIRSLNLDDKWRKAIVERKQELAKESKKEEKVKKPARKKPAKKAVKAKKEKLVEEPKTAAEAEEEITEKKPKAKPKTAPKKPAAKKKETAPTTEEKPKARKKKETSPAAKKKPAEKKAKPKAVKKTPAKRKSTASKKKGGT